MKIPGRSLILALLLILGVIAFAYFSTTKYSLEQESLTGQLDHFAANPSGPTKIANFYTYIYSSKHQELTSNFYTYVLYSYPTNTCDDDSCKKLTQLITTISNTIYDAQSAKYLQASGHHINVYCIPRSEAARNEKTFQISQYDPALAKEIRNTLLDAIGDAAVKKELVEVLVMPGSGLQKRGPFLVTLFTPITQYTSGSCILYCDLTGVQEASIPQLDASYQNRFSALQAAQLEKFKDNKVALLNFLFEVATATQQVLGTKTVVIDTIRGIFTS